MSLLPSFPQNNSYAWSLHQYLHCPHQHPLHLCHLFLHQSRRQSPLRLIWFLSSMYLDKSDCSMSSASINYHINSPIFIFPVLSVLKLFPAALQTFSKRIVQSRANSTLVGVFTILLLFISSFANMVCTGGIHLAVLNHETVLFFFLFVFFFLLWTCCYKMSHNMNRGKGLPLCVLFIDLSSQMLLIQFLFLFW